MQTDLIIVSEYCRICHIEPSFIFRLEESLQQEVNRLKSKLRLYETENHDSIEDL